MNKADLVEAMAKGAGITKAQATHALDGAIDVIYKALKAGDKVTLVGFGTFSATQRQARTGTNPRTGEKIRIRAKKAPKFTPGSVLKDAAAKSRPKK